MRSRDACDIGGTGGNSAAAETTARSSAASCAHAGQARRWQTTFALVSGWESAWVISQPAGHDESLECGRK
jgi:hypothetical protein